MQVQFDRWIDFTLKHYKKVLGAILVLLLPFSYYFIQQRYVNHVEIYFNASDPDLITYKRFQQIYGNEHQFLIVFEDKEIFTHENIQTIRAITDSLKKIKGVLRVFSLTEADIAVAFNDSVAFRKLFSDAMGNGFETPPTAYYLAEKERALASEGVKKLLVSENAKVTAIICEIEDIHVEAKREIMVQIIDAAEKAMNKRLKLRYAGVVYLETELNYLTQKDNETITPIVLIVIIILAGVFLKNFWLSFMAMGALVFTLIFTIGLFSMAGETFDMISAVMSPILLAISVSAAIHLLAQYQQETLILNNGGAGAIKNATLHVWKACLFTSITTCVGFLSFTVSDIRPVRIFGFYTALGIMISFFLTITFIPSCLMLLHKRITPKVRKKKAYSLSQEDLFARIIKKIASITTRHPASILFISLLIFAVAGVGISRIKIETNQAAYFPESNKMKIDMDYVDEAMVGTLPINLLLTAKRPEFDFTHPGSLKMLDEIKRQITLNHDNVTVSFAITDYLKEVNKAFNNGDPNFFTLPENHNEIMDYYELTETNLMRRLLSPDLMEARISFQSRMISNEKALELFKEIESFVGPMIKDRFTYTLTGLTQLYLKIDETLMKTFLQSLSMAFVLIFFMMLLVIRKVFLALLCMIPNIFPIVMTLSIMGWMGIPLDVATIMIASIVLGIAVDDTIHFTVRLQRSAAGGKNLKNAIEESFSDVGRQLVVTSLLLFLGFSLLVMGSVIPVKTFGLLTGFSMLFALVGDLFILPSVIMIFKPAIAD